MTEPMVNYTLLRNGVLMTPAVGPDGTEVPNMASRLTISTYGIQYAQMQYALSVALGVASVRVEYSLDRGSNWSELVSLAMGINNADDNIVSDWVEMPMPARDMDILIRAVVIGDGSTVLTVRYGALQLR